jgi:hypothetical protein
MEASTYQGCSPQERTKESVGAEDSGEFVTAANAPTGGEYLGFDHLALR